MKLLICYLKDDEFVGFDFTKVVGIAQPEIVEITGGIKGIIHSGTFHKAFSFPGDYSISFFVLTRNEKAFGVGGIVDYVESTEVVNIDDDPFSHLVKTEYGEIGVVDITSEFFEGLDVSKIKRKSFEVNTEDERFGDHVLLSGDNWRIAVPISSIKGISSWEEVNRFEYGDIKGFVAHAGEVVKVISPGKVSKPLWVVIVNGMGIPCERFDIVTGEVEEGRDGKFLKVGNERFEVIKGLG